MQERITIRIDNEVAEALDKFASEQTFAFKSKQDAYRFIIRDWLVARNYLTASAHRGRPSISGDGERMS